MPDDDGEQRRTAPARPSRPSVQAFEPTLSGGDATLDGSPTLVRAPVVTLARGSVLGGRYLIGSLLGEGGMGTVYSAHDGDLDEEIALKLLKPELARDKVFRSRLRAEVRLARRVSHPNVCRVHDLGVADELVFVTMELVQGRSLRYLLREMHAGRLPRFELAQVVDVLVQIGSALTAAHRAGVIHRDVKPDNVMLTDGRAVLTDFGVASRATDRTDAVAGTPAYLAPEVLLHQAIDHKVDVYALGALAYELLAGQPPFVMTTLEAAEHHAVTRPAYPPLPDTVLTPELRRALDRVLQRALAADALLRTPSVEHLTEAFAQAARGQGSSLVAQPTGAAVGTPQPTPSGTPQSSVRGTDVSTRRPEIRVAIALAWRREDGDAAIAEEVERIVVDAGGVPLRVVAGEVIAVFGAPRSLGDDAERAARAALAAVAHHGGAAGIDATRVLLRPGASELAAIDVAGGAVALATQPGHVTASSVAARQLAARFDIEPSRQGHRVAGTRPLANAPAIQSYRARELAQLDAHIERAFRDRKPAHVEVRGGAGTGKSRLCEALVAQLRAKREVEWLIAAASPIGAPAPLSMVRALSDAWYQAATGGGAIIDAAQRTIAARRWLEARATARPVVVVVEDVQWADPSTLALLADLRTTLQDVPVAIVTLLRTGDGTLPAPQGVQVISLQPLDNTVAAELARAIAPTASADAITGVVARAAGNPYFIEELARELAEAPPSATATSLPVSVEAVIQARLDHLPDTASQVAHAAAVIGRVFWRSAIAELVAIDGASLDGALAELERRAIISATAPVTIDDDRYQFTQNIVRDVAYARIPPRERRTHHAAVARWLEQQTVGDRKDDINLILDTAHHREQAGDTVAAAHAYRRAGVRCTEQFANFEAAAALRRALELTKDPDAALHEALGDAITETAGAGAAEPEFQAALDKLPASDTPARARVLAKLGFGAARRGDNAVALERYRQGLALAAPDGQMLTAWAQTDPRTAAKLLGGLGWTLGYLMARADEGHPYCERAVALLEGTPYRRDLAFALSRLGGTYMRAGRFADQLRTNQRNLEIAQELGDLNMQTLAQINLGVVHGVLGQIREGIAATTSAHLLALRTGATARTGLALSNLGGLLLEERRFAEARTALDAALENLNRTGHRYVLPENFQYQARLAAYENDLVTARHHAERSRAVAQELTSALDTAVAGRILAQLASRTGDHATARELVEQALATITPLDHYETLRTRAARARILRAAGDASADAAIEESRAELKRFALSRELAVLEDVTEVR